MDRKVLSMISINENLAKGKENYRQNIFHVEATDVDLIQWNIND